ncbi:lipid-A-disaccharide synthase [Henriciella aquimarina]|uniref:lipid-A-disaccharide synthase n=1 Tax=Henriciella aquimarina TaxID=545261 RepID=UPI000A05D905|nr:lipid-A-disaccharide synthase [Henriciella aquimarina]
MASVYLVAAEPSGDLLAAEIVQKLRAISPGLDISGIGGEALAAEGILSPLDISELSVLGFVEGIKIYKRVVALADEAADDIIQTNPDVVALVDSWGYTLRVAQRVRKRAPHIKLVKVVGPQVWATRPGRAKTLAGTVDHLVCIQAFEAPFYEPFGLPVTVMGNPALSRGEIGNREAGRKALDVPAETPLLLVLPGSRRSEIDQVAPRLLDAAKQVKARLPEAEVVVHPAANIRPYFLECFPDTENWVRVSSREANRADVMACADYALACSGTVTSELALQETPFLVGYHTGWITWALARFFLFKPTHITLLNIAADDTEVVPEFVQTKFRADDMAETAVKMLSDRAARAAQIAAQKNALSRMGESKMDSAEIAAKVLLDYT